MTTLFRRIAQMGMIALASAACLGVSGGDNAARSDVSAGDTSQSTIDSLRQDNVTMPALSASELRAFLAGHRG